MKDIKELLGLGDIEFERRVEEILRNIPTKPGTKYLEAKLKSFNVQPWPFIEYLVYYAPNEFGRMISAYEDYDGALERRKKWAKEHGYSVK